MLRILYTKLFSIEIQFQQEFYYLQQRGLNLIFYFTGCSFEHSKYFDI